MRAGIWSMRRTRRRRRSDGVAQRDAGVVLCPTTEANLGDGLPDLRALARVRRPAFDRLGQPGDARLARGAAPARIRAAPGAAAPEHRRRRAISRRRRGCSSARSQASGAAAGYGRWGFVAGRARRSRGRRSGGRRRFGTCRPRSCWTRWCSSAPAKPFRDVMVGGAWAIRQGQPVRPHDAGRPSPAPDVMSAPGHVSAFIIRGAL